MTLSNGNRVKDGVSPGDQEDNRTASVLGHRGEVGMAEGDATEQVLSPGRSSALHSQGRAAGAEPGLKDGR